MDEKPSRIDLGQFEVVFTCSYPVHHSNGMTDSSNFLPQDSNSKLVRIIASVDGCLKN